MCVTPWLQHHVMFRIVHDTWLRVRYVLYLALSKVWFSISSWIVTIAGAILLRKSIVLLIYIGLLPENYPPKNLPRLLVWYNLLEHNLLPVASKPHKYLAQRWLSKIISFCNISHPLNRNNPAWYEKSDFAWCKIKHISCSESGIIYNSKHCVVL